MASKVFVVFVIVGIIGLMVSEISADLLPLPLMKAKNHTFPSFSSLFPFLEWGTNTSVTSKRQKDCGNKDIAVYDENCKFQHLDKMGQDLVYFQLCYLNNHDVLDTSESPKPEIQKDGKCPKYIRMNDNCYEFAFRYDRMYQDDIRAMINHQLCHSNDYDLLYMPESLKLERQESSKCIPSEVQLAILDENCKFQYFDQMVLHMIYLEWCPLNNHNVLDMSEPLKPEKQEFGKCVRGKKQFAILDKCNIFTFLLEQMHQNDIRSAISLQLCH